jgi:hypothetical protein
LPLQVPPGSGKFAYNYTFEGDYASERVLIIEGNATLKPTDGSPAVRIGAGDMVWCVFPV